MLTPSQTTPSDPFQPIRYREAQTTDLEALLRFRDTYYANRTYHQLPVTPDTLLRVILSNEWPGKIFLAETEAGTDIVGYAMSYLNMDYGYGEVEEAMVIPQLQPYNVGDRLLQKCSDATMEQLHAKSAAITTRVFVQERSELTLIAKIARRNHFVPYENVPYLWVRSESLSGPQSTGFWSWLNPNPGFYPEDPRTFPNALVPKLLEATERYSTAEHRSKTYRYILRYRWWSVRTWWAWGKGNGRSGLRTLRSYVTTILLTLISVLTLSAQTADPAMTAPSTGTWSASYLHYSIGDPTYFETTGSPAFSLEQPIGKDTLKLGAEIFVGLTKQNGLTQVFLPRTSLRWVTHGLEFTFNKSWAGTGRPTSGQISKTWTLGKTTSIRESFLFGNYQETILNGRQKRHMATWQTEGTKGPFDATFSMLRAGGKNDWGLDTVTTLNKNILWFSKAPAIDWAVVGPQQSQYGNVWFAYTYKITKNWQLGPIGFKSNPGKSPWGSGFVLYYKSTHESKKPASPSLPRSA